MHFDKSLELLEYYSGIYKNQDIELNYKIINS
jgi:hypothetical protein